MTRLTLTLAAAFALTLTHTVHADEPNITALIQQLSHKDERPRIQAADQLRNCGPKAKKAVPALVKALEDPSNDVQGMALKALGAIKDASVIPKIREKLATNVYKYLRMDAAEALQSFPDKAHVALPELLQFLQDQDADIRRVGIQTMGHFGHHAVPALAKSLKNRGAFQLLLEDDYVRIIKVLGRIGRNADKAEPELIRCLQDKNPMIRSEAAKALGAISFQTKLSVPALSQALADKHADVQVGAAQALAQIGPRAHKAVPALIVAINEWGRDTRLECILALGKIGPKAQAAQDILRASLTERSPFLRLEAMRSLKAIKASSPKLCEALKTLLEDSDEDIVLQALINLEALGHRAQSAKKAVKALRGSQNEDIQRAAKRALKAMSG